MPNHPAPTIGNNLGLITQKLVNTEVGHVAEVTFAVDAASAGGGQDCIDDFAETFNGQLQTLFANTVTMPPPTMLLGDGTNVPGFFQSNATTGAGTVNNDYPPPNCACLVRKVTALAGKKNRGRTYYPYIITEGQTLNNGAIDATRRTNVQTAMSDFLGLLNTAGLPMVIANKTLVTTPPETRPHVTAITMGPLVTAYTVEAFMATQRRRLVRS